MLRTGQRVVVVMWRCDVMLRTGQRVVVVMWRCDVMLRTGERVVLVLVEVRCYVTYWTAGGVSACGGAMLCYVLESGWCY